MLFHVQSRCIVLLMMVLFVSTCGKPRNEMKTHNKRKLTAILENSAEPALLVHWSYSP
jgi:hypothetical protein